MSFKLISILILAGIMVLFIIQNAAVVKVQFLFWSVQISTSLLMFILLAIGIIMGWVMNGIMNYRHRKAETAGKALTDL